MFVAASRRPSASTLLCLLALSSCTPDVAAAPSAQPAAPNSAAASASAASAVTAQGPTAATCNMGDADACPRACKGGDLRSCYFYGRMLSEANGVPKDDAAADALFLDSCGKGLGDSCNAHGVTLRDGTFTGGKKDFVTSLPFFEKGCALESTKGCNNAAKIYQDLQNNDAKALELFARSCALGGDRGMSGCFEGGRIQQDGAPGVAADAAKAGALYVRGCSLGGSSACAAAKTVGIEATLDPGTSLAIQEKNCSGGEAKACADIGISYFHGQGVGKDLVKALPYLRSSCKGDVKEGCRDLAALLLFQDGNVKNEDIAEGTSALQNACKRGEPHSCRRLGDVLLVGLLLNRDVAAATQMYRSACQIEAPLGCQEAGAIARMQGKDGAFVAESVFRAGCARGDKQSCAGLDSLGISSAAVSAAAPAASGDVEACEQRSSVSDCYAAGTRFHKQKDFVNARKYFDLACRGESANACAMVGLYGKKGTPAEKQSSVEAYARGCGLGHPKSCTGALELGRELGGDVAKNARKAVTEACGRKLLAACQALEANP